MDWRLILDVLVLAIPPAMPARAGCAATAARVGLRAAPPRGLVQLLLLCVRSPLRRVVLSSFVHLRVGQRLQVAPDYQKRLASGVLDSQGAVKSQPRPP